MKSLLTITSFLFITLAYQQHGYSQVYSSLHKSFSFGVLGGEYGYDMGIGLEVGTPSIFKNRILFRIKATRNWLELYQISHNRLARYETATVSMVYNTPLFEGTRGYLELGTYSVFPDRKYSDAKTYLGLSCSIGVEMIVVTTPNFNMSYYFSGGIGYAQAYADKLENKPRFADGFVFNNGLRFYFVKPNSKSY
jgi:hypothetical protein